MGYAWKSWPPRVRVVDVISIYVTGTDTGIGKTYASCALLRTFAVAGLRAIGMKPVASGCEVTAQGLRNADAADLMAASTVCADYADINPYALRDPISPHLAAADAGVTIQPGPILKAYKRLAEMASISSGYRRIESTSHPRRREVKHRMNRKNFIRGFWGDYNDPCG